MALGIWHLSHATHSFIHAAHLHKYTHTQLLVDTIAAATTTTAKAVVSKRDTKCGERERVWETERVAYWVSAGGTRDGYMGIH